MSNEIIVIGEASQKKLLQITPPERDITLMDYLREQSISVASSCYGEGVCQKCKLIVNDKEVLSCQIRLFDLVENNIIIKISYL